MNALAEKLLAAHVEHTLERLRGERLVELIREHVAATFSWLDDVELRQVITPAQVMGVIDRYVIQLRVSGEITELAGQLSRVILTSSATSRTRLRDVLPQESYDEFAEKILGLSGLRSELIHGITHSSGFGEVTSRVAARFVTDLLAPSKPRSGPGLAGVLTALSRRVLPELEQRIGAGLARTLQRRGHSLAQRSEKVLLETLDQDTVREVVDDVWESISNRPLSAAIESFSGQDLEDFVVLVHEFWLKFRKSDYFRAVTSEVVEQIFVKYGDEAVAQVIDDMGVTERMVSDELITFLGPMLAHAHDTGFLERQVRAALEPFYRSSAVSALLAR
jgi:hypothetical protein